MLLVELDEYLKRYSREYEIDFRFSSITGLVEDEALVEIVFDSNYRVGALSNTLNYWDGLVTVNMDDGIPFTITKYTPLWIHFPKQHAISMSTPILDLLLQKGLGVYYAPDGSWRIPDRPEDLLGF